MNISLQQGMLLMLFFNAVIVLKMPNFAFLKMQKVMILMAGNN